LTALFKLLHFAEIFTFTSAF